MSDPNADFAAVNLFVGRVVSMTRDEWKPATFRIDELRAVARELQRLYAADVDRENLAFDVARLATERDAAIARAETAERTLQEWSQDYGPLVRQSRQHITTEDADVPVRAADRDEASLTMPLTDGGKDGAR